MTDPTTASARNIAAAFDKRYQRCEPFADNWQQLSLAAALRALVKEVRSHPMVSRSHIPQIQRFEKDLMEQILAIAAELVGTND